MLGNFAFLSSVDIFFFEIKKNKKRSSLLIESISQSCLQCVHVLMTNVFSDQKNISILLENFACADIFQN